MEMGADALSDVLRTVRLTGAVFFYFDLKGKWVAEAPPAQKCIPFVMPGAQHLIEFHLITRGRCWAGLLHERPIELKGGDIIVFPQGDPHVVSSAPGMRNPPNFQIFDGADVTQLPFVDALGDGESDPTEIVCGFFGCDRRPFNPLLEALPRFIHMNADASSNRAWLSQFSQIAVAETQTKRAGGESILARMSELMFVEVIRSHIETLPEEQTGWLAGLRDRSVGRALNLLHGRPSHAWTLDELAKESGLSRSTLSERFTSLIGQSPMQYLARWRMQIAANRLVNSTDSVAQVASEAGYDSDAAFSRAFKRSVGMSPAAWRRAQVPQH
jgi:AraC-like DNA-binding protein